MIDASECLRSVELCLSDLSAAQSRGREDEKFRFHVGAAERHLARAQGWLAEPQSSRPRRVRLALAAVVACSEAVDALRDSVSFQECRRLVRAAERSVSRFGETVRGGEQVS